MSKPSYVNEYTTAGIWLDIKPNNSYELRIITPDSLEWMNDGHVKTFGPIPDECPISTASKWQWKVRKHDQPFSIQTTIYFDFICTVWESGSLTGWKIQDGITEHFDYTKYSIEETKEWVIQAVHACKWLEANESEWKNSELEL